MYTKRSYGRARLGERAQCIHLFAIAFQLPPFAINSFGYRQVKTTIIHLPNQYSKSIPHNAKTFPQSSKHFNKPLSVNAFNKLDKNFNNVTETLNNWKHLFNNQQSLQMCKSVIIIEILERKMTNVNNKQEKYYE